MNYRALIFILVSALALGGLFLLLKPEPEAASAPSNVIESNTIAVPVVATQIFEFVISKGALTSGPQRIQVQQGSEITLKVISDHDDELHLHGYDLKLQLRANEAAILAFTANHSGRFGLELHHAHGEIAALEVMPQN